MKKQRGFTLIELLIVLVIIAILASISIPAYQRYVWKARRSDATNTLQRLAALEEQYYFQNQNVYTTDSGLIVGNAATSASTLTSDNGYYTITLAVGTTSDSQSFLLTAAPVASKSQAQDSQCQQFTLDNTNSRTATNTTTCWPN